MGSTRATVATAAAPAAIGPYVQGVKAGGFVWVSGQIPLDPATGSIVPGGIREQTERALRNVQAVLEAAGSGLDRAVRVTVYLADLGDFAAMNEVYGRFFPAAPPARVCVEVAGLPKGAKIEVEAVALAD